MNRCYILINTVISILLFSQVAEAQQRHTVSSPDRQVVAEVWINEDGEPKYQVLFDEKQVLEPSDLGLIRHDMDFSENLKLEGASEVTLVTEDYKLNKGKRLHRSYTANQQVYHLSNEWGHPMDLIFRVSNDGVAFKYYFPGATERVRKIVEERTSFNFPSSARAWLEPLENVNTGFARSNPSYEMYYQKGISVGTKAPFEAGWAYPALFKSNESWVHITETGLEENYAGTRLRSESPKGEYRVGFPMLGETTADGALYPQAELPWATPWRVITIGNLATLIESTHATDLASPAVAGDYSFVKPGHASWSWAILKDNSVNYDTQKKFIDYAARMGWEYTLIDVDWDSNIGYEKIENLADYAAEKGVGLFLWYNSAGDWNQTYYHPRNRLLTHERRMQEFRRISEMGIKGIKVDFFAGDGQSMIEYYQAIFRDAAQFDLMVNCHGSTLPRGWHRTHPNLMTMEAVKGFEYLTFQQSNANHGASTAAMLPFARNVFDPMDFTPMVFSKIPDIERVTRNGLELAESVIFLSSLQHFAETPEGMRDVPQYVKDVLRNLPAIWEDTRYLDGYPGRHIALARKGENHWYIAGLNGEDERKTLNLDISFLPEHTKLQVISDGDDKFSFSRELLGMPSDGKLEINMKGNGGFVIVSQ